MTPRLDLEVLGTRVAIEVPNDEWMAFVELMWRPFVTTDVDEGAATIEVRVDPIWGWALWGGEELLGVGTSWWFLASEMRYWIVQRAVRSSPLPLLHAATLARDGRALLVVATSGGGKTTLSLALASNGWKYFGDDLAAVNPETLEVTGVPTAAGIRDAARWTEFAEMWGGASPPAPDGEFLIPAAPLLEQVARPMPVGALAFVEYAGRAEPSLEPVSAARATHLSIECGASRHPEAVSAFSYMCRTARRGLLTYGSSHEAITLVEELWAGRSTS